MSNQNEDGLTDEVRALQTLAKLGPVDLSDCEFFENLDDQDKKDVLFLRESRLRDRRFHRFWHRYKPDQRAWIRGQKIYDHYTAVGWWREFTGQLRQFFDDIGGLFVRLVRR